MDHGNQHPPAVGEEVRLSKDCVEISYPIAFRNFCSMHPVNESSVKHLGISQRFWC